MKRKELVALINEIVEVVLPQIIPNMGTIDIEVVRDDNPSRDASIGCYSKGDYIFSIGPKTHKFDFDEVFELICHELMHLVQYETGRLLPDYSSNFCVFDGVEYTGDFENTDSKDYLLAPWEIEARGMTQYMTVLYNEYSTEHNESLENSSLQSTEYSVK